MVENYGFHSAAGMEGITFSINYLGAEPTRY